MRRETPAAADGQPTQYWATFNVPRDGCGTLLTPSAWLKFVGKRVPVVEGEIQEAPEGAGRQLGWATYRFDKDHVVADVYLYEDEHPSWKEALDAGNDSAQD